MASIRSFIQNIFNQWNNYFTGLYRSQYKPPKVSSTSLLHVDMQLYTAQGMSRAVSKTFEDYRIFEGVADRVGEKAVELIKETLEPISRSGDTKDSFEYTYDPISKELKIFSNAKSAYFLYEGFNTPPNTDILMDWMKYKPEFDGLSEKESRRVAFAIRQHMKKGRPPGPASDLGKLPPAGERKYEYLEIAMQKLEPELVNIISEIYL
jgi:hypothetical protein